MTGTSYFRRFLDQILVAWPVLDHDGQDLIAIHGTAEGDYYEYAGTYRGRDIAGRGVHRIHRLPLTVTATTRESRSCPQPQSTSHPGCFVASYPALRSVPGRGTAHWHY